MFNCPHLSHLVVMFTWPLPDFVISVRNLNSKCLLSIVVRNGKIRVRVRVCPFWFRTRMTICHPGSGNKAGFLNSRCGPGSTRKIPGFRNPGFESGWAPFLGLFQNVKTEVRHWGVFNLQLFSVTDCFNVKIRVIFKSNRKNWLKNITKQWSKSAKQDQNFVIVSLSSSNKS